MDARLRAGALAVHRRRASGHRPILDDWTRWFPHGTRRLGRQVLLALMDEDLRAALRLEAPSERVERLVRVSARAFSPLLLVRPFRNDRSWLDYFGRNHVSAPDFERIGHHNEAGRSPG